MGLDNEIIFGKMPNKPFTVCLRSSIAVLAVTMLLSTNT